MCPCFMLKNKITELVDLWTCNCKGMTTKTPECCIHKTMAATAITPIPIVFENVLLAHYNPQNNGSVDPYQKIIMCSYNEAP